MEADLHRVALAAFAALMLVAAVEDFRRLIIPNWLTLTLCLLWPLYLLTTPTLAAALGALGCGALVFIVGALCFAGGYVGGGDVKLLTVAALWAGTGAIGPLLLMTGLIGGALALLLLAPPAALLAEMARARLGSNTVASTVETATPIPYGIAIAGAAVITIVLPQFG